MSLPGMPPDLDPVARLWAGIAVATTIVFTVYGQLVLKWRLTQLGAMPERLPEKLVHLVGLVFDPYIFSGFVAAFLASLAWMAALERLDLSYAYPFMSLNFVIVLLLSALLLHESMSLPRIIGVLLIVAGTVVAARG